jgi:hypothetical protein
MRLLLWLGPREFAMQAAQRHAAGAVSWLLRASLADVGSTARAARHAGFLR